MHLTNKQILEFSERYRAAMINSVTGFKSANLIGTQDSNQQHNLSIVSSVVHLGSHPPLLGIVFRPRAVPRHTLENILDTGFFTVNHVHKAYTHHAHQTSARYDKSISEFSACGLTPEFKADFFAPFVKESRVQLGLHYRQHQEIELNQTVFLVGEIEHLFVPEECVGEDGFIDLERAGTVCISGLDSYHTTNHLHRLPYAKPQ
ncbi:hypothetical protein PALB_18570 [Pseudoalteromonas luteoviolacea B = ATCC 29581]|nr:hypothetical protein PALB_18570 [Pseudoalteromonas luteoviolacea B = ATCC 29581]